MALSVPWPFPVNASEPCNETQILQMVLEAGRGQSPSLNSSKNRRAATIGPIVWEDDGPIPTLNKSKMDKNIYAIALFEDKSPQHLDCVSICYCLSGNIPIPTFVMIFNPPLIEAVLVQRYKRFLADVQLVNGDLLTVHCPNPGAMLGLTEPGNRVWISDSGNPKRKLRHTLEVMEVDAPLGKTLVGINTMLPNRLAVDAIKQGYIEDLLGYSSIRREVPYGENSRIDLLLEEDGRRQCFVEIKNVHFVRKAGLHEFPDCKTARGAKHLRELAKMVAEGSRAVMLYVIQRSDGDTFALADDLDADYAVAFSEAMAAGVEALAIRCQVSAEEISACEMVPILTQTTNTQDL